MSGVAVQGVDTSANAGVTVIMTSQIGIRNFIALFPGDAPDSRADVILKPNAIEFSRIGF